MTFPSKSKMQRANSMRSETSKIILFGLILCPQVHWGTASPPWLQVGGLAPTVLLNWDLATMAEAISSIETQEVVLTMSESPLGSFPPLLKVQIYLQLNSPIILSCQILGTIQPSFISSCLHPFHSDWQCLYLCNPINSLSSHIPAVLLVLSLQHAFSFFCKTDRLRNF